eukprot:tig00001187_g7451.t1
MAEAAGPQPGPSEPDQSKEPDPPAIADAKASAAGPSAGVQADDLPAARAMTPKEQEEIEKTAQEVFLSLMGETFINFQKFGAFTTGLVKDPLATAKQLHEQNVQFVKKNKEMIIAKGTMTIIFAVLLAVAFSVTLHFFRQTEVVDGRTYAPVDPSAATTSVYLNVQTIDPASMTMSMTLELFNYDRRLIDSRRRVLHAFAVKVYGGSSTGVTFKKNSLLTSTTVSVRLVNGTFTDYPFDAYKARLDMELEVLDEAWRGPPLDFELVAESRLVNGFKAYFPPPEDRRRLRQAVGTKIADINVHRTPVFIMYPVFIMVGMWACSFVAFALAARVAIYRNKRAELPMLICYANVCFALPYFRNSAPLAPPIGCMLDFCSFFWTEIVIVSSFVMIFSRFIIQSQQAGAPAPAAPAPPPPPPPAPLPLPLEPKDDGGKFFEYQEAPRPEPGGSGSAAGVGPGANPNGSRHGPGGGAAPARLEDVPVI